jgi:NAD(P)-dependent dehydrogenase (short-subunit alcohol dehydrogenase family)
MTAMGGRICLITGAASGLGRSLAFAAARGASLVLTDIAEAGPEQTVTQIRDRSSWRREAVTSAAVGNAWSRLVTRRRLHSLWVSLSSSRRASQTARWLLEASVTGTLLRRVADLIAHHDRHGASKRAVTQSDWACGSQVPQSGLDSVSGLGGVSLMPRLVAAVALRGVHRVVSDVDELLDNGR